MEINKSIISILKEHNIDTDQGVLCLLGIYFNLDVDKVCTEQVIKSINITKIVDRDYKSNTLNWNIPLFEGQETSFGWVAEWIEPFGRINPERKGSARDAITRMKDFFRKYPEYRKEDVYAARDLYFSTLTGATYLMKSHKFIFDGIGAMKKSTLLEYCEKVVAASKTSNIVGKLM